VRRLLLLPLLALAIRTHAEDSNPECDAGSTGGIEKTLAVCGQGRGRDVSRCRQRLDRVIASAKKNSNKASAIFPTPKATTGGERPSAASPS